MKKPSSSPPSRSFFSKRRALSLSRTERSQRDIKDTKSANVRRLTANNVVLAVSSDQKKYAFSISKVKGYAGQDPSEFGLTVGADVQLDIERGEVKEAELSE